MNKAKRLGFDAADLLAWLDGMRWFGGGKPKIDRAFAIGGPWDEEIFWLAVSADGREYNVPVVVTQDGPVDAAEHPAGQRALLALATASEDVEATAVVGESDARLVSEPRAAGAAAASAHKLTGEQSNTSVIYELADSTQAIVKVFRVLSPGENPDVFLTGVLSDSGTVPLLLGNARMAWAGQVADVLVAQEFLAGSQDAWRTVTAQVPGAGGDEEFDPDRPVQTPDERESIERLGALTRKIHKELAARCGTSEADAADRARLRRAWSKRADEAVALVPGLAAHRQRIDALYAATEDVAWPPLQRIHGDYHLGQVLDAPDRGWVALDFEGEPLRPLVERTEPDLAVRDVAGMVRSFGYAAGMTLNRLAYAHDRPDPSDVEEREAEQIAAWEKAAVAAFLRGYGELSEAESLLLDVLILDKALYELTYEAAQRPDWLGIPLGGVAAILRVDPASIAEPAGAGKSVASAAGAGAAGQVVADSERSADQNADADQDIDPEQREESPEA